VGYEWECADMSDMSHAVTLLPLVAVEVMEDPKGLVEAGAVAGAEVPVHAATLIRMRGCD
jgi:hypothetical protein